MFLRSFDFYFFRANDLVNFVLTVAHLNTKMHNETELCKPGLIFIKTMKSKLL